MYLKHMKLSEKGNEHVTCAVYRDDERGNITLCGKNADDKKLEYISGLTIGNIKYVNCPECKKYINFMMEELNEEMEWRKEETRFGLWLYKIIQDNEYKFNISKYEENKDECEISIMANNWKKIYQSNVPNMTTAKCIMEYIYKNINNETIDVEKTIMNLICTIHF